jgi:hypothetical protein
MSKRPGNLIATVALVVATAGTAFAAGLPGKNSVRSQDIANGEVKSSDLGARSVTRRAFRPGSVGDGAVAALDTVRGALDDAVPDDAAFTDGEPMIGREGIRFYPACSQVGADITASLQFELDPGFFYRYASVHGEGGGSGSGSGPGGAGVGAFGETSRASQAFEFLIMIDELAGSAQRIAGQAMITVHGAEADCEIVVNVQG